MNKEKSTSEHVIYLGMKGSVVALERNSGEEMWRTHLKGSSFVLVVLDQDLILAHTRGELYALRKDSGEVLWKNTLPGLGYRYATIASDGISSGNVMSVLQQIMDEEAAAAASAS